MVKALSRYASAIGIGVALGEIEEVQVLDLISGGDFHSAKASCSSGAELDDCHILILANDTLEPAHPPPTTLLRAFGGVMNSAIDFQGLQAVLAEAMTPQPPYQNATLVQVFAKAEADPSGLVAGKFRHTMLTDSDLHSTRHARAAVGGLIAGVTGDCHVYVSGGAEGERAPLFCRCNKKRADDNMLQAKDPKVAGASVLSLDGRCKSIRQNWPMRTEPQPRLRG